MLSAQGKIVIKAWMLAALAGTLPAQIPWLSGPGPLGARGPQLYGVFGSASFNDISASGPGLFPASSPSSSSSAGIYKSNDYMGSVGASMGWAAQGAKSNFSVSYTPFYFGSVRNPEANALNHSLNINSGTPRRLSRKLTFDLGIAANLMTFNAFVNSPLGISGGTLTGSSLGDLSNAIVRREARTDGLAQVLTGGTTLDTATRVLYGSRSLTVGATGLFNYQYSQRLSVNFGVGGARMQTVGTGGPPRDRLSEPQFDVAVPFANNFFGQAQLSYSLSPQTSAGVFLQGNRSLTGVQDSWATNTRAFIGHTYRKWFFSAFGGVGAITPVKTVYQLKLGPQISFGGSAGYQTRGHVFLATVDRMVGDTFGVGGFANMTSSAAWFWNRPGSRWSVSAGFGHQVVLTSGVSNLDGWRGGAQLQKYLGAGLSMFVGYNAFYARSDFTPQEFRLRVNTASVGLNWSPYAEQALRGPGTNPAQPIP
jgi:hypothetical protein